MIDNENEVRLIFESMLKKGCISSSNTWLEKAIEQRNPRLPISIANSKLLVYDNIDTKLLKFTMKN